MTAEVGHSCDCEWEIKIIRKNVPKSREESLNSVEFEILSLKREISHLKFEIERLKLKNKKRKKEHQKLFVEDEGHRFDSE
jgi:hypothetical protein